ncbi:MAG: heavy-metal-associated domain-containing protein [Maricaulaceae bacterium]
MKYFITFIFAAAFTITAFAEDVTPAMLANRPELTKAVAAGGEPIAVDVLGAVCDFCAMAMKKTMGKHDAVAVAYVDLDTKVLSVVTKPGAELDDATIKKLIKKAGYKVAAINRSPKTGIK